MTEESAFIKDRRKINSMLQHYSYELSETSDIDTYEKILPILCEIIKRCVEYELIVLNKCLKE